MEENNTHRDTVYAASMLNCTQPTEDSLKLSKELTAAIIDKSAPVQLIIDILFAENPCGMITFLDYELNGSENDYQTVGIKPTQKVFTLETFSRSLSYDKEQAIDLRSFGINLDANINNVLINEHANSIITDVLNTIHKVANKNLIEKDSYWIKFKKLLYKLLRKEYKNSVSVSSTQDIIRKIISRCNMIAVKSRIGGGTYLICSAGIASLLQDSELFIFNNIQDVTLTNNTLSYIGTIGQVQVLIDNNLSFNDMNVYVGRKTKSPEHGIYMPIMNTGTIMSVFAEPSTLNFIHELRMRRCIIETGKAENLIMHMEFKFKGQLAKMFFPKAKMFFPKTKNIIHK